MRLLWNLFAVWIVAMAAGGFWSALQVTETERVTMVIAE